MSGIAGHSDWGDRLRSSVAGLDPWPRRLALVGGALLVAGVLVTTPAAAQSGGDTGQQFCETNMAQTVLNMIGIVRLAGPLMGGFVAIASVAVLPVVRRADVKKELKTIRNQGVIWGVVVAPLGTTILQFILNDVVVGASACGF